MCESEYIMYLRKSRADSEADTVEQVLNKHFDILQEFALKEIGYNLPENNVFREIVSGETIEHRPIMKQVLKLIESGLIKGVLVVDPQRLSRGDLSDCGLIVNSFRYSNTKILTPMMIYNLNNKMERKFFEQELMRGNDYLEYVKEILVRGRIASVNKGNFIGSIAPYGYKKLKVKEGKEAYCTLAPDALEAPVVKLIYDLYTNKNMGTSNIAHELDRLGILPRITEHWSASAIKNILQNPVYTGKIRWNCRKSIRTMENGAIRKSRPKSSPESWILVDGKHVPIITNDIFNAAQGRNEKNIKVKSTVTVRNPFAGLLYCECGHAMTYRTYTSAKNCKPRLVCMNQVHCRHKSCLYEEMEHYVVNVLKDQIKNFIITGINYNNVSKNLRAELVASLEKELDILDKKDAQQHDLLEDGTYTKEVFLIRNAKLQERKQQLSHGIENAKQSTEKKNAYKEKSYLFSDAVDTLQTPNVDAAKKNFLLKGCINRITYSRKASCSKNKYDDTPFHAEIQLNI